MSVIDEYLAKTTLKQRAELERLRKIIKEIVPEAEETISFGIPTFKYKKKYLVAFAVLKNNMALYPAVLKFTEDNPLPESVVKEAVQAQLKTIKR